MIPLPISPVKGGISWKSFRCLDTKLDIYLKKKKKSSVLDILHGDKASIPGFILEEAQAGVEYFLSSVM